MQEGKHLGGGGNRVACQCSEHHQCESFQFGSDDFSVPKGYLYACSGTATPWVLPVSKEDSFLKHGMQPVLSAEARGAVQITV